MTSHVTSQLTSAERLRCDDRDQTLGRPQGHHTPTAPEKGAATSENTARLRQGCDQPDSATSLLDDWPARLAQLVDQATARAAKRKRIREELAARRTAGLRARHAGKLRRLDTTGGHA